MADWHKGDFVLVIQCFPGCRPLNLVSGAAPRVLGDRVSTAPHDPGPGPSAFIPPDPGPDMPIPSEPDPGSVSVAASAAISTAIASLNPAAQIMFETSNDLAPDPFFLSNAFSVLPTLLTT